LAKNLPINFPTKKIVSSRNYKLSTELTIG